MQTRLWHAPTRRSHRPDGGSGAYNRTQYSTLSRSSFLCHAEITVVGVKAGNSRGCRGVQSECWTLQLPPAAAPRKESKWTACVGAGRGCRGGRTEAGPDQLRPLRASHSCREWPNFRLHLNFYASPVPFLFSPRESTPDPRNRKTASVPTLGPRVGR